MDKKVEESLKETNKHIHRVYEIYEMLARYLEIRFLKHDASKKEEPEKTMFAKHTSILSGLKYGTEEYKKQIEFMKKDCLNHHYENNSHHPEHYKNGVNDMDLIDILEMMIDWKAACERTKDGNYEDSLEINMNRFHIEEPLRSIMLRTVKYFYPYYVKVYDKEKEKYILDKGIDAPINNSIIVFQEAKKILKEHEIDINDRRYSITVSTCGERYSKFTQDMLNLKMKEFHHNEEEN